MLGTWREQHLPQIVANLANRRGHESVRALVADILRYGFGVEYHQIDHEVRLPEVHGRVDTLFGSVVFEFKRDLRQEQADVSARLPEYLIDRERQTGRRFLGIATDGATFLIHVMSSKAARSIIRRWPLPAVIAPGLAQIWPVRASVVSWPPRFALNDAGIELLANEFFNKARNLTRHSPVR
jgi:hypothetical protein